MLFRAPRWLADLVVALVVGASSIGEAFHRGSHVGATVPLAFAATVAIYVRRRWPLAVLALATAAAAATLVLGGAWPTAAVLFAVYTLASQRDRSVSLPAAGTAALVLALPVANSLDWRPTRAIGPLLLFAVAWIFGDSMSTREREREERIRQAAVDERARIARELHDVITHNVSVMVVQAAAGGEVFDRRPDQARAALAAIEETGRGALTELRRLLGADDGEGGVLPQPSLARLDELVDRVRATGLRVELAIEGTPRTVPDGVGLSAYRIVQESLTNTLKHARATRAVVRLRYRADSVEVEVTDDGVGAAQPGVGRGLIGMRERVALFDGELDAGSRLGGGFGVRARIPVAAS
jgi:signal transduction histidine kinase